MANSELGMGNYSNVAFGMRSSELGRKWNMKNNLKDRTKQFALRVIRLCEALPKGKTAVVTATSGGHSREPQEGRPS